MQDFLSLSEFVADKSELDIGYTLFSFMLCVVVSFIIRHFYIRRSFSLTGKSHIGSIIPILSAVIFFVIVVVKSSLALSLGLVGALSIVRFRTPIKEPEELVYLFFAISIGLGYGAGQILISTILSIFILIIINYWLSNKIISKTIEYNLIVNWVSDNVSYDSFEKIIHGFSQSLKLVRLDRGVTGGSAVLLVAPSEEASFDLIMAELKKVDPQVSITFFEAKTNY